MHEIFISYASADQTLANRVVKGLEQHGLSCWLSSREIKPGADYQASIAAAVDASTAMVVLFSRNALASAEVPKEMSLAGASRKPLIPLRLENIETSGAFRYQLATAQYVDIFEDFDGKLQELCLHLDDICKLSGTVAHNVRVAAQRRTLRTWAGRTGLAVCATLAALLAWKAAPALHAALDRPAGSAGPEFVVADAGGLATPQPARRMVPAQIVANRPEQPPEASPRPQSPEDMARVFATHYYAMHAASPDEALAFLDGAVSDPIRYYGQSISKAKLIETQRGYFLRWPDRQFVVRPASIATSCGHMSDTCRVSGIVDYSLRSPTRDAGSIGAERFSMQLSDVGSNPVVTDLTLVTLQHRSFALRGSDAERQDVSLQPRIGRN